MGEKPARETTPLATKTDALATGAALRPHPLHIDNGERVLRRAEVQLATEDIGDREREREKETGGGKVEQVERR